MAARLQLKLGLVAEAPYAIFGAQAAGCSPVSAAFKAGRDFVAPVRPSMKMNLGRSTKPRRSVNPLS